MSDRSSFLTDFGDHDRSFIFLVSDRKMISAAKNFIFHFSWKLRLGCYNFEMILEMIANHDRDCQIQDFHKVIVNDRSSQFGKVIVAHKKVMPWLCPRPIEA